MENPVRLHWLDPRDPDQSFPSPQQAMHDPNGLLAIGGDLSVTRLIRAYSNGIFPWYNPDEPILWWCPDPRAILAPAEMRISRSLAKRIRRYDYSVTLDCAFEFVLEACSGRRAKTGGTWLGSDMRNAYLELHTHGFAHSVEIWRDGSLIGGLYGVALGSAFFGESMFSAATDASKLALYYLCRQLDAWAFGLIDCQIASAHLKTLGAIDIPRERFLLRLRKALQDSGRTGRWRFEIDVPCERAQLPARLHDAPAGPVW